MKAKSLSPDEKPVTLIVSSTNVACADAYIITTADYSFFASASCVAKGASGQDSDDWSVFEIRCLASNRNFLKHSFFWRSTDSEK